MMAANRLVGGAAVLLVAVALTGCGSGDGADLGNGPGSTVLSAARSEPSGNAQSGAAGQNLANPLRIIVLRGDAPAAGAVVTWNAAGTGAFMTPNVDTTGPDGLSTSLWHLGNEAGSQSAQAGVSGAEGSPVEFSATAAAPGGGGGGNTVEIQLRNDGGNRFEPANVTIPIGTTVTWRWIGGFHDVTSGGQPAFTSSGAPVSAPNTFSFRFSNPGTYLYFCSVHGSPTAGMRGTIVVQ
jgi:plastocyanin